MATQAGSRTEHFMELTQSPQHTHRSLGPIHDLYQPMPNPHLLHGEAKSSAAATSGLQHDEDMISRHRTASMFDTESQSPTHASASDPLDLTRRLKSRSELDRMSANTARKREYACNPLHLAGQSKQSKITSFYESQNEQIQRLLKPVDEHIREAREVQDSTQLRYQIAVYGSFVANILLAVLQLYGAIASGSLSLFTTMADAIFDPMSNITLILTNKAVKKVDARKFPAGRARIETAGNIVFCFLMTAVSFILIAFSVQELVRGSQEDTKSFHLPSVVAVTVAFCTKLGLFLYCWALRNQYSQVRILWEDHRNDLFINGFGVLTSVGGSKLRWWIDPAGAIVLSVLISVLWLHTSYSEFQLLIGISADTETQQLITYVSMTHSDRIKHIDTVRAWHSGPRLVVEVDVVMDPDESLRVSHDIAEDLQMKLESLPNVERAYVHVDYEFEHRPEHFLKKEL
ncbi:Metal tolerance protein 3 [Cladophialophora carrionii]|uniref:Metal tolerance protein 3 n=1 Tax=Cladophialophora carrionii TaxID=86049 RepID=A0A1C1CP51_9EURO|nr:Metal tolerance protein 3 [Cladophialophora carrionii]